ncbi:CoA pyrophosphatase [Photobacterium leiognathi]|uniref:CoA pyrophosphatase n=1 Tax=Photobacterium leiognathi TaxID=553611 RepID=UPI001EDE28DA|nr:CoA pyrophosphatase [Photobacterium leiognathi]MCG3887473.1 CoA pyrophosphatase [Photobacterium leiognathi]
MVEQQQILSRFILAPSLQYDQSHEVRIRQHWNASHPFKQAAVLILLVRRNNGFNVVLTRRAEHLKHHPGQIAFPGGRFEPTDSDLISTALRETFEETNIICHRHDVLGNLPALPTVSGYMVTPFIATINPDYIAIPDPNEVDMIFEAPLNHLLNPDNIRQHKFLINGKNHHVYNIPYEGYPIWGATAQMIKLLSDQIWDDNL